MSFKRGFFVVLFALVMLLTCSVPHQAVAGVGDVTDICGSRGSNAVDQAFLNAMASAGQRLSKDNTDAWNGMAKLNTSAMTCITTLQHLYQSLAAGVSGLTDPMSIITSVLTGILGQLITSVCQSVASELIQIRNAVTSMLTICLPLPSFGLSLGHLNLPNGCSGGLTIPLLTGTGANMASPRYSAIRF